MKYRITEDAEPTHVYANVLVALDPKRRLNNGEPASWAAWLDALAIGDGERVVHIGCGTGYYTGIIAEIVGPTGQVVGVEIDPGLSDLARMNLAYLPHVQVVSRNGGEYDCGAADVIVVNAGVTHVPVGWLDALTADGRLLLPVTGAVDLNGIGSGGMVVVTKRPSGYAVSCISPVGIFPCFGVRDFECNRQLLEKTDQDWHAVRSLRRDVHEPDGTCWLHHEGACFSTLPEPNMPSNARCTRQPLVRS